MKNELQTLEDEVREYYAKVVWSHKIQEKQADIYAKYFQIMESVNIALVSMSTVGIIAIIFEDQLWLKIASAVIALASIFTTLYLRTFDVQNSSLQHKITANRLIGMRDQLRILLLEIRLRSQPMNALIDDFKIIVKKTNSIYQEAPATSDKAVRLAEEALKIKKDNTFTNDEINLFLSDGLKRGNDELKS